MGRKKNRQTSNETTRASTMEPVENADVNVNIVSSVDLGSSKNTEDHNNWFDSHPNMNDLLAIPLPDTPLKPVPKKTKRDHMDGNDTSMEILTAIRELSGKYDQMFQKISAIETTTGSTAKQIETLSSTVTQLVSEVATHKESLKVMATEIQELKSANKTMKAEIGECKRYTWKWTLKLHGVREKDGEDARRVVIEILSNVVPGISDDLEGAVDVAHRLGPKRGDGSNRSIIILFALRRFRDTVWQAARGCKFLLDKKLRLTEALSPEDRIAREKLWPLVKKARDEGKKASFRGSFALIDGKRFNYVDV
nr:uncharacterized protein LOC129427366 [Misgurnus anguillicaudatus]XP_055039774.1 uncharacterized protein LOC129427366 [Misgurnus anguillicaudatus]